VTHAVSRDQGKRRFVGYLAGLLAVLACPCHIPICTVLLSGTVAGAFLNPGNIKKLDAVL